MQNWCFTGTFQKLIELTKLDSKGYKTECFSRQTLKQKPSMSDNKGTFVESAGMIIVSYYGGIRAYVMVTYNKCGLIKAHAKMVFQRNVNKNDLN